MALLFYQAETGCESYWMLPTLDLLVGPSLSAASPTYPPIPWSSHFLLVHAVRRSMRVDSEAVVCWPITPRADTGLYVGNDTWQHAEGGSRPGMVKGAG